MLELLLDGVIGINFAHLKQELNILRIVDANYSFIERTICNEYKFIQKPIASKKEHVWRNNVEVDYPDREKLFEDVVLQTSFISLL